MKPDIPVKLNLPYSDAVLVLGILSVALSFAGGLPGLIIAFIALKLANKPKELYKYAPELYHESSYGKIRAGIVTAWIGIIFSVSILITAFVMYSIFR